MLADATPTIGPSTDDEEFEHRENDVGHRSLSDAAAARLARESGVGLLSNHAVGSFHEELEPGMRRYAERYLRASARQGRPTSVVRPSRRAPARPLAHARTPRPRARQRGATRNKSPSGLSGDDSDPEPEQAPVAHLRGFLPASERMVRHIGRRLGAGAA
jgi:hypothetical protein